MRSATDDERAPLTTEIRREWNAALDNATLDRCRYRTGGEQNQIRGIDLELLKSGYSHLLTWSHAGALR